jgi:hypothetical protein
MLAPQELLSAARGSPKGLNASQVVHDTVRDASESVRLRNKLDKVLTVKMGREQGITCGTDLAPLYDRRVSSLPPMRAHVKSGMRRLNVIMKNLKRMLMTAMMLCIVSVSAFAQKDQKPPPPKPDPPRVVVAPKPDPPPNNNGGGEKKGGKKP